MAFLWGDAFVLYGSDTDINTKGGWQDSNNAGSNYSATTSPFGYGEISLTTNSGYFGKTQVVSGRTILQGRVRTVGVGASVAFLQFYNNGGVDLCLQISVDAADRLVVQNAAGATVHTTAAGTFASGISHYFAIDADIGSASGIVKMWLDQPSAGATPIIDLSAIDLTDAGGGTCDRILFLTSDNNVDVFFSDLACLDSSTAALNAYQGEKRWYVLPPTADGSSVGWTASAGSDYQCVDDTITAASDGDTTNVTGAAGAGEEVFTSAALPAGVSGVVYVGVRAEIKKTDGGVEPVTTLRITNGTDVDSAALALTTGYKHHMHGSPDNPGGSGWTVAQANALEFGLVAA